MKITPGSRNPPQRVAKIQNFRSAIFLKSYEVCEHYGCQTVLANSFSSFLTKCATGSHPGDKFTLKALRISGQHLGSDRRPRHTLLYLSDKQTCHRSPRARPVARRCCPVTLLLLRTKALNSRIGTGAEHWVREWEGGILYCSYRSAITV